MLAGTRADFAENPAGVRPLNDLGVTEPKRASSANTDLGGNDLSDRSPKTITGDDLAKTERKAAPADGLAVGEFSVRGLEDGPGSGANGNSS